MRRAVLDSSAVLGMFQGEAGAEKIQRLVQEGSEEKAALWMSVVNWGELYYATWVRHGEPAARKAIRLVAQMPIVLVPADLEQATKAAELKAQWKLGYADCFAAATAIEKSASLVTFDRDFLRVKDLVDVVLV